MSGALSTDAFAAGDGPGRAYSRASLALDAEAVEAFDRWCRAEGSRREAGLAVAAGALWARLTGDDEVVVGVIAPESAGYVGVVRFAPRGTTGRAAIRSTERSLVCRLSAEAEAVSAAVRTPGHFRRAETVQMWVQLDEAARVLEVDASRCGPACASRLAAQLVRLMQGMQTMPEALLDELPLEDASALSCEVASWNRTERTLGHGEKFIHEAIVEQAQRQPDAVVLSSPQGDLHYRQLEQRSRALAAVLTALGAGPEVAVGLCAHRSADALVACLAILRAGAVYVPLDPGYPRARLEMMAADAKLEVVLVEAGMQVPFTHTVPTIALTPEVMEGDAPWPARRNHPSGLAYVMYTSGSTGLPKGVAISHAGLRNTVGWMQETFPLVEGDVVAHKTSLSFTDSIWELLWPPLAGARLAVIDEDAARFPRRLVEQLRSSEAIVTQFVPCQMQVFLEEIRRAGRRDPLPALRWVFNGGEALPPALARQWYEWFSETRIVNAYGMTESAIYGTCHVVEPADGEPKVLVGHPIANERAYVLDSAGRTAPPLCSGEIHLAGASLARGYLGRPALTAERFVPDPFGPPGTRMYRTGDIGRRNADGAIACLGRLDAQVKVHGARVELGEVEAVLGRHPDVDRAVVITQRVGGDNRLIAFYVFNADDPGPRDLHRFMAEHLPKYMVPSRFLSIDQIPVTVNGKVDRPRLESAAAAQI